MANSQPTEQGIAAFARFFKNYMGVSALVVAALPIPVTKAGLIPTYSAMTSLLSTYTSLFCFLLLGFIFYSRHGLDRAMFSEVISHSAFSIESRRVLEIYRLLAQQIARSGVPRERFGYLTR